MGEQSAAAQQQRRHSTTALPEFWDTEYEDEFTRLGSAEYGAAVTRGRARPPDNLRELQGLNFAARTEHSEYQFRPATRLNIGRRREGEWPGGGDTMEFNTENKENFGEKARVSVVRARAFSNIGLHDDKLADRTEAGSAYRARFGRRAATAGGARLLDTESWASWSSSSSAGDTAAASNESRPATRLRRGETAGGMFALTTETSARYGRRAGLTEKAPKYTMRDHLRTPGPEAKFETYSAHREQFRPVAVSKAVKYKPKPSIKTFDDNYLLGLEQAILKNKNKKRSVSLNSLQDTEQIQVVGEDEILYQAGNYTNK